MAAADLNLSRRTVLGAALAAPVLALQDDAGPLPAPRHPPAPTGEADASSAVTKWDRALARFRATGGAGGGGAYRGRRPLRPRARAVQPGAPAAGAHPRSGHGRLCRQACPERPRRARAGGGPGGRHPYRRGGVHGPPQARRAAARGPCPFGLSLSKPSSAGSGGRKRREALRRAQGERGWGLKRDTRRLAGLSVRAEPVEALLCRAREAGRKALRQAQGERGWGLKRDARRLARAPRSG